MASALRVTNCSTDKTRTLAAAIYGAQSLFHQAYKAFQWRVPSAYTTWFGQRSTSRMDKVQDNLRKARDQILRHPYRCGCPEQQFGIGGILHGKYTFPLLDRYPAAD